MRLKRYGKSLSLIVGRTLYTVGLTRPKNFWKLVRDRHGWGLFVPGLYALKFK